VSDGSNSLMSAYQADNSFKPSAEVSPEINPSPEQSDVETQKPERPESLADRHHALDLAAQDEREAVQSHKANVAALAAELGMDAEDLHLPASLAGYDAAVIAKVMADFGFEAEDFRSPAQVAQLKVACEQELKDQEELENIRQSLAEEESDEDETPDEEESDEDETPPEEEPKSEEEIKPPTERPSSLAELTDEQRTAMQKHITEVYQRSQQTNDPVYTEHLANCLAAALDIAPEHVEKFHAVAEILEFGAQNLLETILPGAINHYMRMNFHDAMNSYAPGFAESYTESVLEKTWNSVAGDDLPKYNTPEWVKLRDEISAKHAYLDGIDFRTDPKTGKPLTDLQALKMKAELVATLCRNQRVTPQAFQDAITKAKADAGRAQRRVSAGRMLGKGKSAGNIGREEKGVSLMDAYYLHNGNSFGSDK